MKKIGKKVLSVFLAASLILAPAGTSFAEEEQNTETQTEDEAAAQREAERNAAHKIAPDTNSVEGWPEGPSVYADSAIVMDMTNGQILYSKQADKQHYPASITKLLTALVALENAELTDEVLFSEDSVAFLEPGDASIGMTPGETLTLEDALYAMLLASANEVSYAIAESVGKLMGGDYSTFIERMNTRAKELGCTGSHWANANGLHDEEHYTTAHDMAVIASAVYQFEEFRKITQTLSYTIEPTNLVKESRTFQQNHKMLWPENANYYEYCTGGKTGYTDQARTTLVTMADNGEVQLAAVVLYDFGNDAYLDTRAMFDYAFESFQKTLLSSQDIPGEISSFKDENAYMLLPDGISFSGLEQEITIENELTGDGTVAYTYHGQNMGSYQVVLADDYIRNRTEAENGNGSGEEGDGRIEISLVIRIAAGVAIAAIVLVVYLLAFLKYKQIKRRKMRRRRKRGTRGNSHHRKP